MSDIDLQQFCGADEIRLYLNAPFRFNGFSYATNGHIMVRVPAREQDAAGAPEKVIEAVAKMFEPLALCVFLLPPIVDLPPAPPVGKCAKCQGRGVLHASPCCDCHCEDCDGRGDLNPESRTSTNFAGALFNLKLVRQMLGLPGLRVATGVADSGKSVPLLFTFDGGVGVLMPLHRPMNLHVDIERK